MTDYSTTAEGSVRDALRKLWSIVVLLSGTLFGLVIVRLVYWPPHTLAEKPTMSSGQSTVLGTLLSIYVAYAIWSYTIRPWLVLLAKLPDVAERRQAFRVICKSAITCGLAVSVPMAIGFAFDLPSPLGALQLLLILGAYTVLKVFRGPAITAAISKTRLAIASTKLT